MVRSITDRLANFVESYLNLGLLMEKSQMKMEKSHDGSCCYFSLLLVGAIVAVLVVRLGYVFHRTGKPLMAPKRVRTLVVLGSGGHTAEMLSIVNALPKDRFTPRFYVAAVTDDMSLQKARALEESLAHQGESGERRLVVASQFVQIYRSREVGQSYLTSAVTTLIAMAHGLWLMFKIRPQVIICNGPGTCIPICIAVFFFKVAGLGWSSVFYIESIARVKKLSLSGLLLYKLYLADQIFVQWPQLQKKYSRVQYVGRLM